MSTPSTFGWAASLHRSWRMSFQFPVLLLVCLACLGPHPAAGVQMPETLDLARHAKFALNALNGTTDERGEFMFSLRDCASLAEPRCV